MKKLTILYMEGYGATIRDIIARIFRKPEKTLSIVIDPIIEEERAKGRFEIAAEGRWSFAIAAMRRAKNWILGRQKDAPKEEKLLYILGKSMGGPKLRNVLDKYWNDLKDYKKRWISYLKRRNVKKIRKKQII